MYRILRDMNSPRSALFNSAGGEIPETMHALALLWELCK